MSRNRCFSYKITLPDADPFAIHDEVCPAVIPQSICSGGSSSGPVFEFWRTRRKRAASLKGWISTSAPLERWHCCDGA